jgi:hypothetical protein
VDAIFATQLTTDGAYLGHAFMTVNMSLWQTPQAPDANSHLVACRLGDGHLRELEMPRNADLHRSHRSHNARKNGLPAQKGFEPRTSHLLAR